MLLDTTITIEEEKSELKFSKRGIDQNCGFSRDLVLPGFNGISAINRQSPQ